MERLNALSFNYQAKSLSSNLADPDTLIEGVPNETYDITSEAVEQII